MAAMQDAVSRRDFTRAAQLARSNLAQVARFIRSERAKYGSFDIRSIPALEIGGTVLVLAGDDEGLTEMRTLVTSVRALASVARFR